MNIEELKNEMAEIEATLEPWEVRMLNEGRSRACDAPRYESWQRVLHEILRAEAPKMTNEEASARLYAAMLSNTMRRSRRRR